MKNTEDRKKVLGAWLGKAVGGTLGQPWEGCDGPLALSFYDPVPTEMIPNDDLDIQVLWACKLATDWNGEVSLKNFSDAWVKCIGFPCDEYGVAIRNLKLGIPAPYSGSYDNWFADGLGSAIRSELWAVLAPGEPELAAKLAGMDACVDHDGNGVYAEQFLAALESYAFVESDTQKLIKKGLSLIPADSELHEAISNTVLWCKSGKTFTEVRAMIMGHYKSANFTDVKMNLPFVVAAMLLGGGDFAKSICYAVNFGQDADCTGATVGAILGIINPDSIPQKWLAPIGSNLVVSKEITGINPPSTLDEFTDMVIGLRAKLEIIETEIAVPDLSRFSIPMRRSFFAPWFAKDYRKFSPCASLQVESITVPGNLFTVDFHQQPQDSLMMLEIEFYLEQKRFVKILVNTPANMRVWIDEKYCFGRESGAMVPAFHRALLNQMCELTLTEGWHKLMIGVAPADEAMKKADILFGIADEKDHWIHPVIYR